MEILKLNPECIEAVDYLNQAVQHNSQESDFFTIKRRTSICLTKKINLSVYSLPRTFYVKYNILAIYVIASINVTAMFFIWCIRQKIFDDLVGFSLTFLITIFSIYTDLDALHGLMRKQFVEVADKYIRIKKLNSDITLNWHEIKSVEEIYNVKFHNLIGAKLKRRDKGKGDFVQ